MTVGMASESDPSAELSWPSLRLGRPGGAGGVRAGIADEVEMVLVESDEESVCDKLSGVGDESDDELAAEFEASESFNGVRDGRLGGMMALILIAHQAKQNPQRKLDPTMVSSFRSGETCTMCSTCGAVSPTTRPIPRPKQGPITHTSLPRGLTYPGEPALMGQGWSVETPQTSVFSPRLCARVVGTAVPAGSPGTSDEAQASAYTQLSQGLGTSRREHAGDTIATGLVQKRNR